MGQTQSSLSSTAVGYAVVFSVAGAYALWRWSLNRQKDLVKIAANKFKELERTSGDVRKESKAKKQRMETYAGESKSAQPQVQNTARVRRMSISSDDGINNKEFAQQYSQAKEGTKFSGNGKTSSKEKKQKSIKQSKAQEKDAASEGATQTGVDADDDQSLTTASPASIPADTSGVADMLEKPRAAPSIIRLTDTTEPAKPNRPSKPVQAAETKKQRQNRQKAEAAKFAREDDEKERKVKMEAQRRLARISEGRAAKDGSTPAAKPITPAVWANGNKSTVSETQPAQLLDTLEPKSAQTSVAQTKPAKTSTNGVTKDTQDWKTSLPSEEEQMQMLKDEEEWSTVATKVKSKKGKATGGTSVSNSNDDATAPLKLTPEVSKPVSKPKAEKKSILPPSANGRPKTFGQQSSFAALANGNATDEQEEEWDV